MKASKTLENSCFCHHAILVATNLIGPFNFDGQKIHPIILQVTNNFYILMDFNHFPSGMQD